MIRVHKYVHEKVTLLNRIQVLSSEFSQLVEKGSLVLDVGTGSGDIASIIAEKSEATLTGIDVLHHTSNVKELLSEASRIARKGIIIKDHNCNSSWQNRVLRFTDWFGNAQYNVHLEFNFKSRTFWKNSFKELGLIETSYINPKLYPTFTRLVFWKDLDFISKLNFEEA